VLVTVAYAFVRIELADKFLTEYGLSIWWFAAIEISSSILFGVASARFVKAVLDPEAKHRNLWGLGTLIGFTAPDAFVFISTKTLPKSVLETLVLFVLVSVVSSVVSIRRRIAKGKQLVEHPATLAGSTGPTPIQTPIPTPSVTTAKPAAVLPAND
jgi:hypothetical protein